MFCIRVCALLARRRRPSWCKKGIFSNVEKPPLVAYSAFSRKKKRVLCKISWHFLFTWLVLYLSRRTFLSLTKDLSFSHRGPFFLSQIYTDEQNTQRPTETLSQPITQSVTANLSWKASVNSVCRRRSVGSKLCAKMLRELCVLCERKNSPAWEKNLPPHVSNILFLTEEHRRTEHTNFHRDIKSTDITERYS